MAGGAVELRIKDHPIRPVGNSDRQTSGRVADANGACRVLLSGRFGET